MSRLETIAARLRERFPEAVVDAYSERGEDVVVVGTADVAALHRFLRDDEETSFDMLADVSAVDWLPREPRFDVNWHLYSFAWNARLRLKTRVGEDESVASAVDVWPTANWQEREVWDLMGITFDGHPDLRRILLPDEWEGHPHRKDYPTGGVPVEYRIEPAYMGQKEVSEGRPSMGGVPARLRRDHGSRSPWTWTGPPALRIRRRRQPPGDESS